MMSDLQKEIDAMSAIAEALDGLDEQATRRVLEWASSSHSVSLPESDGEELGGTVDEQTLSDGTEEIGSLAELFALARPTTNAERALVAGYWLQVGNGQDGFSGAEVNRGLRDLGHELSNVTMAFNSLKGRRPALAIQTSKAKGKTGHKVYRLTAAGLDEVHALVGTAGHDE